MSTVPLPSPLPTTVEILNLTTNFSVVDGNNSNESYLTGLDKLTAEEFNFLCHTTAIILGYTSMLSSLGVVMYWLHSADTRRRRPIRIIAILSMFDILMEIPITSEHGYDLSQPRDWPRNGPLCTFFGTLYLFGGLSIWLWTGCIAVNLAFILFQKPKAKQTQIPIKYLLIATMGTSLVVVTIVLSLGGIGVTETAGTFFCLIKSTNQIIYIVVITVGSGSVWLTITFIYGISGFSLYRKLFTDASLPPASRNNYINAIQKSVTYPTVFILCWFWSCILWSTWATVGNVPRWVTYNAVLTSNLSGILNSTSYFFVQHFFLTKKPKQNPTTATASASRLTKKDSMGQEEMSSKANTASHVLSE